ncbi:hypothetical protein BaRGS_00011827, partial [Batillaria attramentaria]
SVWYSQGTVGIPALPGGSGRVGRDWPLSRVRGNANTTGAIVATGIRTLPQSTLSGTSLNRSETCGRAVKGKNSVCPLPRDATRYRPHKRPTRSATVRSEVAVVARRRSVSCRLLNLTAVAASYVRKPSGVWDSANAILL